MTRSPFTSAVSPIWSATGSGCGGNVGAAGMTGMAGAAATWALTAVAV